MLFQQAVDGLNLGAGSQRDAFLARTAYDFRETALLRSHGIDDRDHLPGLAVVDLRFDLLWQVAHAGQLVHEPAQATHVLHLFQLRAEVLQVEAAAFAHLGNELFGLLLVDLAVHFLDQ